MTAPVPPDYTGSAGSTPTTTSGNNPLDVWHLGAYYGQPIGVGVTPANRKPVTANGQDLQPGKVEGRDVGIDYQDTQDYISQVAKLWAKGTAGTAPENVDALREYTALQNALYNAGAYGATSYNKIRWGQWDGTEEALVRAVKSYEDFVTGTKTPMTFSDYLASHRVGGIATGVIPPSGAGSTTAGGGSQSVINLTDPTEVRAAAQQAAQAALGHTLSGDELNAFVDQFHAAQAGAQTATSGEASLPDLSSEAMAFSQTGDNAQEFANHQAQGYRDAFLDMFLPAGSRTGGVAPVTPVGAAT